MSAFLIICGIVGAYSMLNLMGGERQRRLDELRSRLPVESATNDLSTNQPTTIASPKATPAKHA